MHRNFEAMNIGKEPPDDNGKAPRPMKTYAAGALAAANGSGNFWTSLERWPTPTFTPFYLGADGSLGTPPLSNDSEAIATVGTSVLAR